MIMLVYEVIISFKEYMIWQYSNGLSKKKKDSNGWCEYNKSLSLLYILRGYPKLVTCL